MPHERQDPWHIWTSPPIRRSARFCSSLVPAFVFRGDGRGILWANAAGVAFFGASGMGALLDRRFFAASPTTRSLARLAKALPVDQSRLEILRFNFGVRQVALAVGMPPA